MSYNCNIVIEGDIETLKILEEGLSQLKEAQVEIFSDKLIADFREDCSGIIDDIATEEKLTFVLRYYNEDEELYPSEYINGIEWK